MSHSPCCRIEHTQSVEDYLKALLRLSERGPLVLNAAVAERLGVSPASVSSMVGRLAEHGLVTRPCRGRVTLTAHGRHHGLTVVRRHRLWESYLHTVLGVDVADVHTEAEELEHALSPGLEKRLAAALGDPKQDPHGSPIPPPQVWPPRRAS